MCSGGSITVFNFAFFFESKVSRYTSIFVIPSDQMDVVRELDFEREQQKHYLEEKVTMGVYCYFLDFENFFESETQPIHDEYLLFVCLFGCESQK